MEKEPVLTRSAQVGLKWSLKAFADLSVFELQAIHRLRQLVFVVEQQCAFADADEWDEHSLHLMAWQPGQSLPCAYTRLIKPGQKNSETTVGRVLTAQSMRGLGLGLELMERALHAVNQLFPSVGVRLAAQAHLQPFYGSLGFVPMGEIFLEDGIPHIEMLRPANR